MCLHSKSRWTRKRSSQTRRTEVQNRVSTVVVSVGRAAGKRPPGITERPDWQNSFVGPVVTRALIVLQAVAETIADLESRVDARDWSDQIAMLKTIRRDLVNEIRMSSPADA
jgi:hypothetical protein